jgi:Spy/CpxP family protein refolding chaperone
MKNRFMKTLLAGLVTTVIATSASWAQPAAGGQGGAGRGGAGMLDQTQRQAFTDAMAKDKDAADKLTEQLTAAQKELLKAVLAEKYVEATVLDKAKAVSDIQTKLIMLRAKALSTVAPTMKPEQKEQLIDNRFGYMMLSGFGGGGMGMRGPGAAGPGGQGGGRGNRGGGAGGNAPRTN